MNIWLVNHYAVPPQYYPLARQTNFAKNLIAMGHTVTVFAASTVHNSTRNLITDAAAYREETVNGVHYVYIKCVGYQGNGARRIYNMCEFAWKLPGVCKHFRRPDAIVATSMPPMSCAVGIHLARKYKCRGVAEIADLWPESLIAYGMAGQKNPAVLALRWLEKWIYKKSDAIVFTMEGGYDYIVEQGWQSQIPRAKVHHINNGVELETFNYNKEHFRVEDPDLDDPDTFKVVYTGSIRRVNNLGLLLDAARAVQDARVKFLIWGDGDERAVLEKRAVDEKISNVVFKGSVEKNYIPYIVSRADLNYVHGDANPLFRFGVSPNKLFDYFAAGKPILQDFFCEYNLLERYACGKSCSGGEEAVLALEELCCLPKADYDALCAGSRRAAKEYDFRVLTEKLMKVIEE